MEFRKLVAVFDRLEGLSSRNEMRRGLADQRFTRFRDDKGPEQATTARESTMIARGGTRERNRRRSQRGNKS